MRAARAAARAAAVAACALGPVLGPTPAPAAALAPAAPSPAADTVRLDPAGQVTDRAGALGRREGEVQRALWRLEADAGLQLFVAYVHDFSGHEPQSWADFAAVRNRLGSRDLLLAVATGEGRHAVSADVASGLTAARLREVDRHEISPALRAHDWAGAALGAAHGYSAGPVGSVGTPSTGRLARDTAPGNGGKHVVSLVLPLAGLVVAALLIWYLARHGVPSRRRLVPRRWSSEAAEPPGGTGEDSLERLNSRARGRLIDLDDAVRDRAAELSFATGDPPRELGAAAEETAAALRTRHHLDDPAVRRDGQERRRLLEEILARCETAGHRLEAVRPAQEPGEALRALRPRADALPGHIARAEQAAGLLPPDDPVRAHPQAARERLARVVEELGRADEESRRAVRAAQVAVVQAEALAEGVPRRARELDEARARLAEELPLAEADLAKAREEHALHGLVARAEPVLARAWEARQDPFGALRDLAEVDGRLAEAVGPEREGSERAGRARTLLGHALLVAGSELAAAQDFLAAHRDRIGTAARARLAEAAHHLWRARQAGEEDAALALPMAWRADALAREGRAAAAGDAGAGG
ncbi:TPM domain-containing protein [Streptomyces hoynatensis]|uniref:TPM domain-containing protein n=1 Tax=Streptomyces hoynatensis TaxID=1141874 RepID=A0A3A9ZI75_9ACTN|nr:TPM domain-containing protein [Streptomyces hoynatensis]RKN47047.1 TPM domain-containing protein [Streptomyces hoynatensis]